jgi:stage IV sporulation protein FB
VFLAEPAPTPYDLQFRLLGIRVRVVPWFWLVAVLLGWNLTQVPDQQAMFLTLWIGAVFVSILVHELGHALAMRFYGIDSYVVLYQFGGLAIPEQYSSRMGHGSRRMRDDPLSQIVISAAGPAAQLGLALAIVLVLKLTGYGMRFEIPFLQYVISLREGRPIDSVPLEIVLFFLMLTSVFWSLLNLLPVYPLDGGQIARNVFSLFHPAAGIQYSLILSVVTGATVAMYGFAQQQLFLAIMFALLAFSSFQVLQAYSGRGGYGP